MVYPLTPNSSKKNKTRGADTTISTQADETFSYTEGEHVKPLCVVDDLCSGDLEKIQ